MQSSSLNMNWKFWKKRTKKKSALREWVDALLFAIIAATIIRAFLIEAFTIPTPSMENSLLVGDFLFVSKVSYGPRSPITPVAFPLVHQTLPIINTKAYSEIIQWKYKRFPGFGEVKRDDAVVFNFPLEDDRPIDKRTHYIKRCVGLPGETISIDNRKVSIDNEQLPNPEGMISTYLIKTDGSLLNTITLEEIGISANDGGRIQGDGLYTYICSKDKADKLRELQNVKSVEMVVDRFPVPRDKIFPPNPELNWSTDNYGPLYIPKAGTSVPLNRETVAAYYRIITSYEGNNLQLQDSVYLVNGKPATEYTFAMDYYFMMGDNRDNSADSRFWGFVPENHVVGKAVFIWMSFDKNASFFNKIRWNRLFRTVKSV